MVFRLWSDDFADGGRLSLKHAYNGWGHAGENVSPHLAWEDPPAGTRSFTLTMFDPDPASDSGFWHWIVVNIPASARSLSAGAGSGGALPSGALQIRTDYGQAGYGGPAPGPGATNRYVFTLHAVSVDRLDPAVEASGAMASWLTNGASLAKARIVGLYV